MKVALEAARHRQPRLPLTDGGVSKYLPHTWGGGGGLGGFRQFSNFGAGGRGGANPDYRLNYRLTDACFWVVSRGNDCHYCIGHQELKLRLGGSDEDSIGALDSDWLVFEPRKQAALAFARKLTLEPDRMTKQDIASLRTHLSDAEVVELAFTIGVFNSVNRWTDGIGLPLEETPNGTSSEAFKHTGGSRYEAARSDIAPVGLPPRRPVPAYHEVQTAIAGARARSPHVDLPSGENARRALLGVVRDRDPYEWERAMSQLQNIGPAHVRTWNTVLADEHLPPRLKAEITYVTAVHNRSWYAVAHAMHRLNELGMSSDDVVSLTTHSESTASAQAAVLGLAAKSTTAPHLVSDEDIAAVRAFHSDAETAQVLQVICLANLFDRFTESLGLPVEATIADASSNQ